MVKNNSDKEYRIDILKYDEERSGESSVKVRDYPDEYIRNSLVSADETVIKDEKISIVFTYPLSKKVILEFINKGGFTRLDLFRCIYEGYKKIYDEEEKAVGDPGTGNMSYNRRKSEGPYGIWGHYLDDLWLDFVKYNSYEKTLSLTIGS